MPRPKGRNPYVLSDGTPVPGVTSILGILNKPFLIPWANRMGLQGIDTEEYTKQQKRIGTLVHDAIHRDLQGQTVSFAPVDNPNYTAAELRKGENGFSVYRRWAERHRIEPILMETPLVSEIYRYGGTIDFYGQIDGEPTLLDFTTEKSIYSEKLTQVVAYQQLLLEQGYRIDALRVIRLPRDIDEGTVAEDKQVDRIAIRWELFLLCLKIYPLLGKVG